MSNNEELPYQRKKKRYKGFKRGGPLRSQKRKKV